MGTIHRRTNSTATRAHHRRRVTYPKRQTWKNNGFPSLKRISSSRRNPQINPAVSSPRYLQSSRDDLFESRGKFRIYKADRRLKSTGRYFRPRTFRMGLIAASCTQLAASFCSSFFPMETEETFSFSSLIFSSKLRPSKTIVLCTSIFDSSVLAIRIPGSLFPHLQSEGPSFLPKKLFFVLSFMFVSHCNSNFPEQLVSTVV